MGTGNQFLVPYFSKRLKYFITVDRTPGTSSLLLILVNNTNVSKVQIGNNEIVPDSFLTILGFILVWGLSILSECKACN